MRIVHLAWEYPPIVYGGLGRHVSALARAQAEQGHCVTVVTQRPEGTPAHEVRDGVEVLRVDPDGPFPYHLPSLLTWVGGLDHGMGVAASSVSADVVHAHDWMVARAGSAAATTLAVPLVATIHATEAGRHSGWLPDVVASSVHLIEQWLADEADEVIVCSQSMADEVQRAHHVEHITVIPNGIDPAGYRRTSDIPADLLTGSPRLSFVGRIEWEKGVFVAIEALPVVLADFPQAQLRIVGTGGQTRAVARLVDELGIAGSVRLLGHVDEATLRAVYSSTDLLLAPSSYEPFGIVALEGAAMGVPLVVGDTGGLAEFVTDARGRRARPQDPPALAAAILEALCNAADTEHRARTATAALTEYSWARIAERTVEVYRASTRRSHTPRLLRVSSRRVWNQEAL